MSKILFTLLICPLKKINLLSLLSSSFLSSLPYTLHTAHIPPVVAMSTSAVVAIILIVSLTVGSVVVISLYISYRRYRNRFTETANFSFVRLNSPSKWEKFKFQVNHLKDRMMRRSSKVGLVNINDDTRSSVQYGSTNLGRFDSQGSL